MSFLSAALTLVLIMDPFANLPLFNNLLSGVPSERRLKVLLRECLVALAVLLICLWVGQSIMGVLGLKRETLSIGGGVVLFLIALKMVFPEHGLSSGKEGTGEEPFIVPLAIPMMAGPSAIAFVILLASKYPDRMPEWSAVVAAAWAVVTLILSSSGKIEKILGKRTLRAIEKLAGMMLIMLAIQMILNGWAQGIAPSAPAR